MKLALRNRIAEWLLEALAPERRDLPVRALLAFAEQVGENGEAHGLDVGHARELAASTLFLPAGDGVRLREDLAGDLEALRERASRFAAALAGVGPTPIPSSDPARAVAVAAILFEHRLFFEVHEILEPPWQGAQGDEREILQGLIQVAVGLHHHENDNLRGAISLLADGNAKLFAHVPEAFGIDLASLCRDVESFATALRHVAGGDAPAELPPLPRWRKP